MASADVVVCDYWWVFDPQAAQIWPGTSRFGSRQVALIVDEAHLLIPRVRGARDVVVSRGELQRLAAETHNLAAREIFGALLGLLFDDGPLAHTAGAGLAPSDLRAHLDTQRLYTAQQLYTALRADAGAETLATEERIVENLLVAPTEDGQVVWYTVVERSTHVTPIPPEPSLHIRRVDATELLATAYNRVHASLTLSATLAAPKDAEEALNALVPQFGLRRQQTRVLKAASPFDPSNQLWVYSSLPLGTYQHRHTWYPYYIRTIVAVGQATPGVTAVFFSSYQFLQEVLAGLPQAERDRVVVETRADADMSDGAGGLEGYEQRLRHHIAQPEEPDQRAYLFAVYTGKLAQGANFAGNLIKTVVCVSVPAELPSRFHQRLCRTLWPLLYPDQQPPEAPLDTASRADKAAWGAAWDYAYERPAMYHVLQAVGRGIRSEADRCAFVLLDHRYHNFAWHEFLAPEPFHTETPQHHVRVFHEGTPERFLSATGRWEALLATIKPL
jgi:Rad3-related DNA helicase